MGFLLLEWGGAAARPRDKNFLRGRGGRPPGRVSVCLSVTLSCGPIPIDLATEAKRIGMVYCETMRSWRLAGGRGEW